MRVVREGSGIILLLVALGIYGFAVTRLTSHDYVAAILSALMGTAALGSSVELLRPSVGE